MSADLDEAVKRVVSEMQASGEVPLRIPHARFVQWLTFAIIGVFAIVSGYVLFSTDDATIRGAIIGTWTTMATSAGAFWLGASSGGKMTGKGQ